MVGQTIEKSDERIGTPCKVAISKSNGKEYIKAKLYDDKFGNLKKDDIVYVLTESEHQELLDKLSQIDDELSQRDDEIAKRKEYELKIKELDKELDKNKKEIDEINDNRIAQLQDELDKTKKDLKYWKNKYKMVNYEHETLYDENEKLKNENTQLTIHNKELDVSNTNSQETIQELKDTMQSKEQELKETIQNQQQHIDEMMHKYQSLLPLKDYIPVKQHYEDINKLKDKIKASENEIVKINANVETQLAEQKQELESIHHDKIMDLTNEKHKLEKEFTDEKAQILVTYKNDLSKYKIDLGNYKSKYKELAKDYKQLVEQLQSLTRINTLVNGRHNEIKKGIKEIDMDEIDESIKLISEHEIQIE